MSTTSSTSTPRPMSCVARRADVVDPQVQAAQGAGRHHDARQPLAEHDGAGRSRRRELHHPDGRRRPDVVVEVEADLLRVDVLRPVDVGHWNGNELDLHRGHVRSPSPDEAYHAARTPRPRSLVVHVTDVGGDANPLELGRRALPMVMPHPNIMLCGIIMCAFHRPGRRDAPPGRRAGPPGSPGGRLGPAPGGEDAPSHRVVATPRRPVRGGRAVGARGAAPVPRRRPSTGGSRASPTSSTRTGARSCCA